MGQQDAITHSAQYRHSTEKIVMVQVHHPHDLLRPLQRAKKRGLSTRKTSFFIRCMMQN